MKFNIIKSVEIPFHILKEFYVNLLLFAISNTPDVFIWSILFNICIIYPATINISRVSAIWLYVLPGISF